MLAMVSAQDFSLPAGSPALEFVWKLVIVPVFHYTDTGPAGAVGYRPGVNVGTSQQRKN